MLKENSDQEVDPKSLEKFKDMSYFSVFSRSLTRNSYLKVSSLQDRNGNEVDYKKYDDHIIMTDEAIQGLRRCLAVRIDDNSNRDCAIKLALFYHELLRLAKYDDDGYGISSNAISVFGTFLKKNTMIEIGR